MISLTQIDTQEVLRYLGYGNNMADSLTLEKIQSCAELLLNSVRPRYVAKEFSLLREDDMVRLSNTDFVLTGKDIYKHLEGCKKVILFGATLSVEADRLIRQMQIEDLTKGIIMDCCATALIEQACDHVDSMLATQMQEVGLFPTSRYSPGYGDLPIMLQKDFLQVLDAPRKIGLCVSQSHILTPRKSVTAIVGFSPKKQEVKGHSCEQCNRKETCLFQKRGDYCDVSNAT